MKFLCHIKHNWKRFPEPNKWEKSIRYCARCHSWEVYYVVGFVGASSWVPKGYFNKDQREEIEQYIKDNDNK